MSHVRRNRRQQIIYFFSLFIIANFILASSSAFAHVKWFITDASKFSRQYYPLDFISVFIFCLALSFILFCFYLNRASQRSTIINHLLYKPLFSFQPNLQNADWPEIGLKSAIAILLMANILQGHFIAPHFNTLGYHQFFILLQAGFLLALVISQSIFSIGLIITFILLFFILPMPSTIDYFPEFIAISIALYFSASQRRGQTIYFDFTRFTYKIQGAEFGLVCLRVGLGLQLIILTIHDKLISPAYGLAFLIQYPHMNFLHYFGYPFSQDIYFVLCAGLAELCFGILLIFNIAARLALVLVVFFFTLSGVVLDISELIGHLPILVSAIILFCYPARRAWERVDGELELLAD